ncbi:secreted RxLR effector protein 161-like [Miscanthus floridulus]|uniref:secreted RxLR effector protein 161-like n=1 Tax=Miscanthus floridulus TaxID=154761 RepID=UPI00345746C4
MEEKLKLSRESMAEEVDPTRYRWLSWFIERPTMEHLQAVKRILSYVVGTLNYGLHYGRAPNTMWFIGCCDSDLTGDMDTSKSTTRKMFFLDDCLVSWQSLKQKVVALSSCEAEYIAATTAATQALWLSRMLAELLGKMWLS